MKFTSEHAEMAAKFILEEVHESENLLLSNASNINPMNGSHNSDSQFLFDGSSEAKVKYWEGIVLKASERIKFLNKYIA
jgi:hypothetical protein